MHRVDSRKIEKGDCFVCLKGERVDGHAFLEQAAKSGAKSAVVGPYEGPDFGLELIRVEDPLWELQERARKLLVERGTKILAITGSVGKTTTKEFAYTLLEGKLDVVKSPGNANSQVGLPLTILNSRKSDYLLLEMGMSHRGDIVRLIEIAPPTIALVTRISASHTENFKDGLEGVAKAKAEIFLHPRTEIGIINKDSPYWDLLWKAGLSIKRGFEEIESPFEQSHLAEDFRAAATLAVALGMSKEEISTRIHFLKGAPHRFERKEIDGILYVDDSYNANPDSMIAALKNLPKGKRRVAVLGQMNELGTLSKNAHRQVMSVAKESVDHIFCLGEKWEGEQEKSFEELEKRLSKFLQKGDVVLVKGSNSLKLWRLVRDPISS